MTPANAGQPAAVTPRQASRRDPLMERAALYLRAAGVAGEPRVRELLDDAVKQQARPYGLVPRGDRHVRLFEAAKALSGEHGVKPARALPATTPRAMPAQPLGSLPGVLRPEWWSQQARWARAGSADEPGYALPCVERSPA